MSKVIFEFDETKNKRDIQYVINRDKIMYAFEKLSSLHNKIYNAKLYNNEMISVKDGKVLTDEDYKNEFASGKAIEDTHDYVDREFIEEELMSIIDNVVDFIYEE